MSPLNPIWSKWKVKQWVPIETNGDQLPIGSNGDQLPIGFNGYPLFHFPFTPNWGPIANWFQWGPIANWFQWVPIVSLSIYSKLPIGHIELGFNGGIQWGFNW